MLPRFHWSDITTVGHYLGVLILFTGLGMFLPALIAVAFGEWRQLGAFIVGIGVCAALGSALRFLQHRELDRRRSLLLVGFGWIVIGIVASVPLYLSGSFGTWFDALFDSVSAITSTGVTIARDIDGMSYSQTTWHVVLSFVGAMAVIAIALHSGFFGEGSKLHVRDERQGSKRRHTRIGEIWIFVMRIFLIFAAVGTVAASIVCFTLGFEPIDALMNGFWLAACAVGTSGFVPHTSDLVYYHSITLQLVLSIMMIAGALSIGVYVFARRRDYRQIERNSELRVYALWIVVLVISVTIIMTRESIFTTLGGFIQNGVLPVISAATTCGMQTVYPEQMGGVISEGVIMWLIVAIFFGACAYSTGGGVKIVRILEVLHWIRYSILLRLAPDNALVRIKYEQFGSKDLSAKDATLAMTVLIMYMIAAALGSMAFIAHGYDALDSVFEAISYLSNCGMTTSITQQGLPIDLKVVALLLMWVGRVEFVALLAAIVGLALSLHPSNLFSNMRSRNLRSLKSKNSGGTAWRRRKGQKPKGAVNLLLVAVLASGALLTSLAVPGALASPASSAGAEVSIQDIENLGVSDRYHKEEIRSLLSATVRQDKRDVVFEGEAIGVALVADAGHKWVNVRNDGAMIGVYMSNEQADSITKYGRYEQTGDIIEVKGSFNLACADHNGELGIDAHEVAIVKPGGKYRLPVSSSTFILGLSLTLIGIILTVIRQVMRKKPLFRFRR